MGNAGTMTQHRLATAISKDEANVASFLHPQNRAPRDKLELSLQSPVLCLQVVSKQHLFDFSHGGWRQHSAIVAHASAKQPGIC